MDFETIMARLAEATDAELGEAFTAIGAAAQELRSAPATEETVTRLESLAAARTQIQAEQTRRTELSDRQAAALANFTDETPAEEETPEEVPAEDEGDEEEDGEEEAPEGEEAPKEEPVTAGAKPRKRVGSMSAKRAGNKPPAKKAGRVVTTARVQGNIPGFEAGQTIDRVQLATAMSERFNTLNRTSADGRYHVARIQSEFPAERMLTKDSWAVNTERIEAATGQEALVAAGGLCAPRETDSAIANVGVTARPIRAALTRCGGERGGMPWRAPVAGLASSTCSSTSCSSSKSTGLDRYASASMAAAYGETSADSAITGMSRSLGRRFCSMRNCQPFMPGIIRSSRMRSGACASSSVSASSARL